MSATCKKFTSQEEALDWLHEEFPVTQERPVCDLIDSIFLYADELKGEKQKQFMLEMLSETLGLACQQPTV